MGFVKINREKYEQLTADGTVLATHRNRPSIIQTHDQKIIKHIYRRRLWSSSTIWPYASRFQRNAIKLNQLSINAPLVDIIYYYPEQNCDLVVYPAVAGKSVHQSAKEGDTQTLSNTPSYIAKLHQAGIYFRDLHLGNLIFNEDDFTLVDLASIKIFKKPLSLKQRIKNLLHLKNRHQDKPILENYGWEKFISEYLKSTKLSEIETRELLKTLT